MPEPSSFDWYSKAESKSYTAETDPDVLSVRQIYNYYNAHDIETIIMGAPSATKARSKRSPGELASDMGDLPRSLDPKVDPARRHGDREARRGNSRFCPGFARVARAGVEAVAGGGLKPSLPGHRPRASPKAKPVRAPRPRRRHRIRTSVRQSQPVWNRPWNI